MADTTLTGAEQEVTVDTEAVGSKKKMIIKVVVIIAVLFLAFYLYKRFVK